MAKARAKGKKQAEEKPVVEEKYFRSESAYLCLLVNRRKKLIRVVDFRAGALPAKRLYIQSIAKQEGIQKVITLVEKDEVSSWTRVGFVREGTVPGFYKRSDGHLCGCVIGDKTASVQVSEADAKAAERLINQAKKAAKEVPENIKGATSYEIEEADAMSFRDEAVSNDTFLHAFDAFGRDAASMYFQVTLKGASTNIIRAEYQDCFGHALIEPLYSPDDELDLHATTAGLRAIGNDLKERGIVAAFAFGPSNDLMTATAFVAAGYRKTGLLAQAYERGEETVDLILWTRKLANPAGDDLD